MSIQSEINELNSLDVEIKRISNQLKSLRKRKSELEDKIVEFLEEKKTNGFKFGTKGFLLEERKRKVNKKRKDWEKDAIQILKDNGVSNPEKVYGEIKNAKVSENKEYKKLKITELA